MLPHGPRRRLAQRVLVLLAPLALLAGAVACTDDPPAPDPIFDGATLVAQSAAAMARITSAHVVLEVDPPAGSLPITRNEGDLTSRGSARGTVQFQQADQLVAVDYLQVAGGAAFLRWPTDPHWLPAGPVIGVYDPAAILDRSRGVARLLASATGAGAAVTEQVDGLDAWRVDVTLEQHAADALVPGLTGDLTGQVWIDKATKRALRVVLQLRDPSSTLTLSLTDFDADVVVQVPSTTP